MTELVNDRRRMWKLILFSILTLGIYSIIFYWKLMNDMNTVCGFVEKNETERCPHYVVYVLLNLITFGIYSFVWFYKQGNRIKRAGKAYGLEIDETGGTYLLWILAGALLFGIGPFIAIYLLIGNVNKLASAYNYKISHRVSNKDTWTNGHKIIDDGGLTTAGGRGVLRFISGTYSGLEIPLNSGEELIIGRNGQESHLILQEGDISRKHCSVVFSRQTNTYYITDFSTYGTYINDTKRLEKGETIKCPIGSKITLAQGNNAFLLQ